MKMLNNSPIRWAWEYALKPHTKYLTANLITKNQQTYSSNVNHVKPMSLTMRLSFPFVIFPISSKYYQAQLPVSLDPAFRIAEKQQKLNEKVLLLQHIAEMVINDPKLDGLYVRNFLVKQLKKWLGSKGGRFQRVATVAWIIRKMRLKKELADVYEDIVGRIDDDEWYVDFDESVKAIEAFSDYQNKQMRDKIFMKIERNLGISLGDVSMTYYQRICASLYEAERYRSPIWQKLEGFVTRNLSMQYSSKTFFDIFKYFAITQNGSSQFYQICQTVIQKGHVYNNRSFLRSTAYDFDATGDYYAMMIETYAIVNKYTPFPLSPDFLDHIYKTLLSSKLEYKDISSLTKLINHMSAIEFYNQQIDKVVYDVIENKQFSTYHSLVDIQSLYFSLQARYKVIPNKLKAKVENLVKKDLNRNLLPLQTAIQSVEFLLLYHNPTEDGELKQETAELIDGLNNAIQKKYKYLRHEQKQIVLGCLEKIKSRKQIQERLQIRLLPKPVV